MTSTPSDFDLPHGAISLGNGRVLFRVWAPKAERVELVLHPERAPREIAMQARPFGYFEHVEENAADGLRYAYRLDEGPLRPDPASRHQPDGVHQPSAVFLPESFEWTDSEWAGVARDELVIYELHVGTFTPEGTFAAVVERLPELRELGVTAIEIMPVSQFPGERNWGYDGVHPYAAQDSYGGPRELQRLIDAAHREGLAVLLDVVYNHLGPEGNYLAEFGHYFTDRYHTPWGLAINYDGPHSEPVRRYVIENAVSWVRDFHVDGLRLDAIQTIYDLSARHILEELQSAVQGEAERQGRIVHVIGETDQNDVRLVTPKERGGIGLDAVWSDGFHHAVHSLLTSERDGYFQDYGGLEHLAKSYDDVFVYDGGYSKLRRRRHGNPVGDAERSRFVVCLKNHDQIGNRAMGDRYAAILSPEALRLACGLFALNPGTLLLFMGCEYGEKRPFPFFCSFGDPDLIEAVRHGRRREFAELDFEWGGEIPDPQDAATFESAKLSWDWPDGSRHAQTRQLMRDLLHARRGWSGLRDRRHTKARIVEGTSVERNDPGTEASARLLLIERGIDAALVGCANINECAAVLPAYEVEGRRLLLSTADSRYGGDRRPDESPHELHPYELVLFGPAEWSLA
ncbi:MAG: malto-oligosyltrehalose trehalohydrolase [Planctomycetaceae bacterium]